MKWRKSDIISPTNTNKIASGRCEREGGGGVGKGGGVRAGAVMGIKKGGVLEEDVDEPHQSSLSMRTKEAKMEQKKNKQR